MVSHANTLGVPVWDAVVEPESVTGLGAAAVKALERFGSTMARLRERAEGGAPIGELLEETLNESGYMEALEAERTIEAQGRIENLQELVGVAREYDATAEDPSLGEFLQQIALFTDQDSIKDDEGLVTLMTLHNAKGLEYPVVFMIGCEDGVFPHSRAIEEGDIEEERRLCYVGITPRERELYLTYARTRNLYGSRNLGIRSRFIDEIPRDLTDMPEPVGSLRPDGPANRWRSGGGATTEESLASFALGDDVIHAAFGEGVIVGVEPGGIVVVRFPSDGSERKLMAEYAPIRKR